MRALPVVIDLPDWCEAVESMGERFASDLERMRLVVDLARLNVEHATGGPFGAAVFEAHDGRLVALGVNSVVRLANSVAHAEIVALVRAEARVSSFSLDHGGALHVLYSSCEPCTMCLGAIVWSGVRRVVYAAHREDAERIGFDEGPIIADSAVQLRGRGIRVEPGSLRDEACAVLTLYHERGGPIYNG